MTVVGGSSGSDCHCGRIWKQRSKNCKSVKCEKARDKSVKWIYATAKSNVGSFPRPATALFYFSAISSCSNNRFYYSGEVHSHKAKRGGASNKRFANFDATKEMMMFRRSVHSTRSIDEGLVHILR